MTKKGNNEQHDADSRTSSSVAGLNSALFGIAFLVLLYAASPGPLLLLVTEADGFAGDLVLALLAPLEWLYENCPPYERFIVWQFEVLGID